MSQYKDAEVVQQYVFFDFDGTLADTFDKSFELLHQTFAEDYNINISKEEIKSDLASYAFKDLLTKYKVSTLKSLFLLFKMRKFLKDYTHTFLPFPGIEEEIKELSKTYKLGVLTMNSKSNIRTFLKANDLSKYFDYIYSSNIYLGKDRILKWFKWRHSVNSEDLVYIGDDERDVTYAQAADIKSIAVGWGYKNNDLLKKVNPDAFADKPGQITDKVNSLLS